ncbi:MAG: hypothetical protein AB7I18_10250 [Candidatus Berkiella sp.]
MRRSIGWKIKLFLDDIDVSSNLIDSLTIEAEEGSAKIAEFSLIPHAGPISVTKWIGKSVVISFQSEEQQYLLFKGVVDEPVYDPTSLITTFTCTDQLQEQIRLLSKIEINQLIQGYWSPVVFDNPSNNWLYAQDQLSTIPASLDLDNYNEFQLTPWKCKLEPDYVFDDDKILYQSMQVQLANRREIHNQGNITFQYRFQRLKQREVEYIYVYPLDFCEQNYRNSTLPNVEMIKQAIDGTGWLLKGNAEYEHQRGPGWVKCGDVTFGFMIKEEIRKFLVREARFVLAKRFVQTVTEHYELTLKAPQSIAQLGVIANQETLSYEVPGDTDKFINISKYQPPLKDSVLDAECNYVKYLKDDDVRSNAIHTKLNQAKTTILKSHRNNIITFKTLLHPSIQRMHTVKLDSKHVKAQGKVKHIIHECDFNQGSCITTIAVAVSRTDNDDAVLETGLVLQLNQKAQPEEGKKIQISLPTHLGGRKSALPYNDAWDGYTGNEKLEPGAKTYPERFAITAPGIETAQVPEDHHFPYQFDIAIPNELLLLKA